MKSHAITAGLSCVLLGACTIWGEVSSAQSAQTLAVMPTIVSFANVLVH